MSRTHTLSNVPANDILLMINKPAWCTSFDVIRKLQKIYGKKTPIGHAWTLDPFATGLLLIGIGKWTKRLHALQWLPKVYTARIDLTRATDTRDCDPWETASEYVQWTWWSSLDAIRTRWREWLWDTLVEPTLDQVQEALQSITWTTRHTLTPFNAKKIGGIKWYERARKWEPLFIPQDMDVYEATLLEYSFPYITARFSVWTWTYIRSLANTLGKKLRTGGICDQLHRDSVGEFGL